MYGILPHGQDLWVCTAKGLSKVVTSTLDVRSFNPKEGWQSGEFSEGAYFKNSKGVMFFGGVNGLNSFHPLDYSPPLVLPKILIEKVNEGVISQEIPKFKISTVEFGTTINNKVIFRIIPQGVQWNEVPESGVLIFNDLPEGNYTLEVKNSLETNSDPFILQFSVEIPFWKKPVFFTGFVLVLLVIAGWWRFKTIKKEQQKLELKIHERTRTIATQKLELEKSNTILEAKNKEIEDQKARLQLLHCKQKNPDFEMGKFSSYFLEQVQKPLSEIKLSLESSGFRDRKVKSKIDLQLNKLLNFCNELNEIDSHEIGEVTPSLTILNDLFKQLNKELSATLKEQKINYEYIGKFPDTWLSLDVIHLKMFLRYLLREVIKFLDEDSELKLYGILEGQNISLVGISNSKSLLDSIEIFKNYSMYVQAAKRILVNLNGSLSFDIKGDKVCFQVLVPFEKVDEYNSIYPNRHWKHLLLEKEIPVSATHILICGRPYEVDGLTRLLEKDSYFISQEEDISIISSAIELLKVDLLIIYNESITEHVTKLIKDLKEKDSIPTLYVYENLSYGMQERLIEMGVQNFLQLPTGKSFIYNRVKNLIKESKNNFKPAVLHNLLSLSDVSIDLSPNQKLVRDAVNYIKSNFDNPEFRVESLHEDLGLSKIKLYRIFKDILQTSPSIILQQLRMEKALTLLKKSHRNVSEVSYDCGYNDPKHFSKMFKKYYEVSPKKYHSN